MNQINNNNAMRIISKPTTKVCIMTVCLVVSFGAPAAAQSGGGYDLSWSTIDGGGGTSTGGPYTLTATIGQPDAAWTAGPLGAGGDYELLGGFWPGPYGCFVDFETFARFAKYWFESGTGLPADLHEDNTIDGLDLKVFADYWLCYCPLGWQLE